MAIDPSAFFALQNQVQTENRLRDQSDANLSNSFMGLTSLIMRLSQELGMMTSIVSSGQKQENTLLTSLTQGQELQTKGILGKTVQEEIGGGVIGAAGGGLGAAGAGGGMGGMSALLGGGLAAGGLASIIGNVLSGDGGGDGGGDGDTSGDLSGSQSSEKAFNYFVSRGYSKEQSAAIVGNLLQENSTLNPKTTNSIGHKGIAQWDPEVRYPALVKFSESKGLNPETLEAQLQFTEHELSTGSGGLSKSRLQSVKTLEEATKLVRTQYLRPGESEAKDDNRLRNAQDVLKRYGGNVSSSSSTSSSKPSNVARAPGSSSVASAPGSSSVASAPGSSSESNKYEGEPTENVIKVASSQIEPSKLSSSEVTEPPAETSQGMIASVPELTSQQNPVNPTRGSSQTTGDPFSGNPLSTISALSMGIQVG